MLIEVRERSEYEVVHIPGSINIPVKEYPNAFALSKDNFKSIFGITKPSPDKELVFLCAAGLRAKRAYDNALKDGYVNSSIYPGSMNDWVANGGHKLKL